VNDPSASPGERSGFAGAALGFAVTGWLLFALTGPLALAITWFGDCAIDECPVATDIDRAIYLLDVVAWLAFPVLAFLAYRGRRPASVAIVAIGAFIAAQSVAGMFGAAGFGGFSIVLPAGALIGGGGLLGLGLASGEPGDRAALGRSELAGLGCLSLVVTLLALQGLFAGIGGPIGAMAVLVAVVLVFITILAFVNRGRRQERRERHRRG
jgi:hypothetical protein